MRDIKNTRDDQATAKVDESALIASRSSAVALIDEGNALEEQGRIAEAMARYDAAVKADPQCARAHLNRGNILASTQFDEARRAYQLALTCDPHYGAAHFNLGNLNFRAGEFGLALRNYQAATEVKPDFADAFVAMANTLDSLGRATEAVESYERALIINPGYAEVHFNLGFTCNRRRGVMDEVKPRIACARRSRIRRRVRLPAHCSGPRIARSWPNRRSPRVAPAGNPHRADNAPRSLQHGRHIAELGSNPQLEEAAFSLRRAAEIRPDFASKPTTPLGTVLSFLEQLGAAETSLRRALAIDPQSPEIL